MKKLTLITTGVLLLSTQVFAKQCKDFYDIYNFKKSEKECVGKYLVKSFKAINKLPYTIDPYTDITNVQSNKNTIIYTYDMKVNKDIAENFKLFSKFQKQNVTKQNCTTAFIRSLMRKGFTIKHDYYNKSHKKELHLKVTEKICIQNSF